MLKVYDAAINSPLSPGRRLRGSVTRYTVSVTAKANNANRTLGGFRLLNVGSAIS